MKEFILKWKKWLIAPERVEYVMHYLITALSVGYALIAIAASGIEDSNKIYWGLAAWGGGVLLNAIPEVFLPKPNYKDVVAGSAGGTQSLIVFLIIVWVW